MRRTLSMVIVLFALILSACSIGAIPTASPVVETKAASAPTATRLPPTSTPTISPTFTQVSLPSPTREPTATPWRPVSPKEKCVPSETRFCKVLFILPAKYYAEQARPFFKEFEMADFKVSRASKSPDVVEVCSSAVYGPAPEKTVMVDLSLSEVKVADYDAIVYIGGWGCQDQWHDEEAHQIARDALAQGRVLGAVGCAPTILAYAGVMEGKRAAICDLDAAVKGGKNYCKVLQSLGVICSNYSIERDGLIVTAGQKSPSFVPGVIQAIMENTTQ